MQSKLGWCCFNWAGRTRSRRSSRFFITCSAIRTSSIFRSRALPGSRWRKLISTRRAKHVAHHYAEIGGKSPILEFTQRQAAALETRAAARVRCARGRSPCATGIPSPAEAIEETGGARARTNWCCCRSIRSIRRPPPAAASTNGTGASIRTAGSRACTWSRVLRGSRLISTRWSRPIDAALRGFRRPGAMWIWSSARTACRWR